MKYFIFGNGLSYQPTNGNLAVGSLTERLIHWLDDEGLYGRVAELVAWANPDDPGLNPQDLRGNFEKIAGGLQRLGEAVQLLESMAASLEEAAALQQTAQHLGLTYRRVVGFVLHAVDDTCQGADRTQLAEMAEALIDLHAAEGVTIYSLNYDSLLHGELLALSDVVYDGFRYLEFNDPLDPWGSTPKYYPLHGSAGMYIDTVAGRIGKRSLEDVRAQGVLTDWRDGLRGNELPSVVLGDAKVRLVQQEPFASYYSQLRLDLSSVFEVVVGGYGFGDVPLNRTLGEFLALDPARKLFDWRPQASQHVAETVDLLRRHLPPAAADRVLATAIVPIDVHLPSADAVRSLT